MFPVFTLFYFTILFTVQLNLTNVCLWQRLAQDLALAISHRKRALSDLRCYLPMAITGNFSPSGGGARNVQRARLPSTIPLTSGPQMQLPPVPMTWHSPPNALPAEWKLHFGAPLAGWISVVCKGEPPEPAQDDPPQAAVCLAHATVVHSLYSSNALKSVWDWMSSRPYSVPKSTDMFSPPRTARLSTQQYQWIIQCIKKVHLPKELREAWSCKWPQLLLGTPLLRRNCPKDRHLGCRGGRTTSRRGTGNDRRPVAPHVPSQGSPPGSRASRFVRRMSKNNPTCT